MCTNVTSIYILCDLSIIVFTAAVGGNKDCAAQLIRKGARVNDTDKDGKTALMIAVVNGHLGLVDLLLDNSADISLKSAVSSCFTEKYNFPKNQLYRLLLIYEILRFLYIRAKAKANFFRWSFSLFNVSKCKQQIGFSMNPLEATSLSLLLSP